MANPLDVVNFAQDLSEDGSVLPQTASLALEKRIFGQATSQVRAQSPDFVEPLVLNHNQQNNSLWCRRG